MNKYEKLLLSPVERRIIENSNLTQDWVEAACGKQHLKTLNGVLDEIDDMVARWVGERLWVDPTAPSAGRFSAYLRQRLRVSLECKECGGSGLSRLDCICHGGGGATVECSPCLSCKGIGIELTNEEWRK